MNKFAENLSGFIAEKGMTYTAFGKAVGVSACRITEYIRNDKLPTVKTLLKIADYFGCSTDYLLGLDPYAELTFKPCPPFCERLTYLKTQYPDRTAQEIYTDAGISQSRYYDWLSGKRQPSVENLLKLAKHLDCRIDYLLGRE